VPRKPFLWVKDEPDDDPGLEADEGGRPERSEHRAAMLALKELANRLADLTRGQRRSLPLAPDTLEALDALDAADGRVERRRLLMRAKLLLGREDVPAIEAALAGDTPAAARERELQAWAARILRDGDAEIQQFVEVWPAADRGAIRGAARECRASGVPSARLLRALRDAVDAR